MRKAEKAENEVVQEVTEEVINEEAIAELAKRFPVEVKIYKIFDEKRTPARRFKAFATITIDGTFAVHDVGIVERNESLRVVMPYRRIGKLGNFKYLSMFHPTNNDARHYLEREVLAAYEAEMAKRGKLDR